MRLLSLIGLCMLASASMANDLTVVYEDQSWALSPEDLAAMPTTELNTRTPWTVESDLYAGVALRDLMAELELEGGAENLRLIALNDYAIEAPLDLLIDADAIVVFERNGELMPVRAYGPYWLLFPFTERPELVNRDIRNVSVWQLKTIEFIP